MIMLDTHVVVWLHTNALSEFSARAVREIELNDLAVSPMVELELGYFVRDRPDRWTSS